jgi:aryl-alcohol dehydrogenase-like predicted oxidoreductase
MAPSRRHFLGGLVAAAAAGRALLGGRRVHADTAPQGPRRGAPREGEIKLPAGGTMPLRPFGRTGVKVSMIGIGGYHIGMPREDKEATRIIHAAIDHGVTFMDNCWDYHDGKSEQRMGAALAEGGRRQKVFLMTKLDGRTGAAATGQLEQSLKRLRTDVIDLVQIHEVIRMGDPERVFGPGGAIEALVAAQKAGKLRYIGFTGHKDPSIHLHMLETAKKHGFTFDSVQMPLNVMDAHYKSFQKQVLPVLAERGIAPLGMKPIGSGLLLESGAVRADECLRYTMSLPTSVTITGCDTMGVLEQALALALAYKPLDDQEKAAILAKSAPFAAAGKYEKFKTSSMFDGTAAHPEWLERA